MLGIFEVSKGGISGASADVRIVFAADLKASATGIKGILGQFFLLIFQCIANGNFERFYIIHIITYVPYPINNNSSKIIATVSDDYDSNYLPYY